MKILFYGFIFGFILPIAGLFIGLQVSPLLANVMMFPIVIVSSIFDQPFGNLPSGIRIGLFIFSGVFWSGVFFIMHKISTSKRIK